MVIFMYCRSPLRNCLYESTPVFFDGIDYVALAINVLCIRDRNNDYVFIDAGNINLIKHFTDSTTLYIVKLNIMN